MAAVASYLLQVRPTFLSAVALFALAMTPSRPTPPAMQQRLEGLRVELDFDAPPVIRPAPHPDARPWPHGMVIGMGAPSVDPGIVIWDGSPLDNLLSVMLAPLRALGA